MALSNAQKLVNLGFPAEQAKLLQTMIEEAVLGTGSVSNVNVAADADIATSKLEDGTEIATLVTAVGTPAAFSEVPADLALALVAAGLMVAEA